MTKPHVMKIFHSRPTSPISFVFMFLCYQTYINVYCIVVALCCSMLHSDFVIFYYTVLFDFVCVLFMANFECNHFAFLSSNFTQHKLRKLLCTMMS